MNFCVKPEGSETLFPVCHTSSAISNAVLDLIYLSDVPQISVFFLLYPQFFIHFFDISGFLSIINLIFLKLNEKKLKVTTLLQ